MMTRNEKVGWSAGVFGAFVFGLLLRGCLDRGDKKTCAETCGAPTQVSACEGVLDTLEPVRQSIKCSAVSYMYSDQSKVNVNQECVAVLHPELCPACEACPEWQMPKCGDELDKLRKAVNKEWCECHPGWCKRKPAPKAETKQPPPNPEQVKQPPQDTARRTPDDVEVAAFDACRKDPAASAECCRNLAIKARDSAEAGDKYNAYSGVIRRCEAYQRSSTERK